MFLWGQTDEKFFELLRASGENIEQATKSFLGGLGNPRLSRQQLARSLKGFEDKGDTFTRQLVALLNQYFVTPFDRDDIMQLAVRMDDMVDRVEAAAARLAIYRCEQDDQFVLRFARILSEQGSALKLAIYTLCDKNLKDVLEAIDPLYELEKEADETLRDGLTDIFDHPTNPFLVIKKKEVYETLEEATDYAKDVADTLRILVMNHA